MIEWKLPIRTVSEANKSEHWAKGVRRHRDQKNSIRIQFLLERPEIKLPCEISLTRVAPRRLDGDNLCSAFKWIRDSVSENILGCKLAGRADDDPRFTWTYSQVKGEPKEYAVIIRFLPKT